MGGWKQRAWMAAGLALALLTGLGLASWRVAAETRRELANRYDRDAVIELQAATQLVQQASGDPDAVRVVAQRWTDARPAVESVRVVRIAGVLLEASTAEADRGSRAAPRRLRREEKTLSDQAQRLRAAVQVNREEGTARKDEIEVDAADGGGLRIAGPLEEDGTVVGLIALEMRSAAPESPGGGIRGMVTGLVALLVFLLLAAVIGERKWPLAAAALVVFVAALGGSATIASRDLGEAREATEQHVASTLSEVTLVARSIADGTVADAEAMRPSNWDADRYRRPFAMLDDEARIDEGAFVASVAAQRSWLRRVVFGSGTVGLLLLGFVGLGTLARVSRIAVQHRVAYAYAVPAMAGMLVLVFLPFTYGITLAFTDSTIYNTDQSIFEMWVGLDNFKEILFDFGMFKQTEGGLVIDYTNFYYTLLFTIVWTVSNVAIGVVVGLILALILNTKGLALRPIYRVIFILPWAVPNYITALIWQGMFHQQFGVINQFIQMLGGDAISWFEKPLTSFITVLTTNGWLSVPFMMVISLGALQSIPSDLYEAARVDGASRWEQFRFITLPSLKPALVPALILSVIWTFNMFNVIYLVSQGEPGGATEILITDSYKIAFEQYRYGYAAAYSTIIFLILLAYGVFQNRATRATEGA